ncbi:lysine N(6)-hydroxylase/L-ornithine N(5)-oxygenase family protein [Streptomyces vietnamensis]|uniref:lysine N(6)-hydroxylase/L-ornithine N(5)-oxygenase family protein n=1 Tax=Streptomyces vietnamensis TaxID=362257 RepID=UPI00099BA553|nr:SidA/IucD/PvdA family monooxygenase [Streptomyces vietnamensis]
MKGQLTDHHCEHRDLVGIGIGPANLGLSALLDPELGLTTRFFERRSRFTWHDGAMLPEAGLQVSPLKDLVTLVDPTSRFSFLNFLAEHGRLYRHLIASRSGTPREEFEQYYRWAAGLMPQLTFGSEITEVRPDGDALVVRGVTGPLARTRNLVLGSGRAPYVPGCVTARGEGVVHSAEIMRRPPDTLGRRVVVIGGGQSGAEIVHWLLGDKDMLPSSLVWSTRRDGFLPLDDSAFSNEWYFPGYVRHFTRLSAERRAELLRRQRMTSDGVSGELLDAIHAQLYRLDALRPGSCAYRLSPGQELLAVDGAPDDGPLSVVTRDMDTDSVRRERADVVILATGYRNRIPAYLGPLRDLIPLDDTGAFRVRPDYAIEFDGPPGCRIFVQGAAGSTHGVADANLSLMAWRNAVIANAVAGRELYRTEQDTTTVAWSREPAPYTPTPQERITHA